MDQPDLLLLDEPTSGLDLPSRERLIASLDAMADANADLPTVLVTHHLEEIPATTTHALLLRDGAIVAAGPIGEVLTSGAVSTTFDIEVEVAHNTGRWAAMVVRSS
jgi:iron complex transport system ATP-binding protein